MKLLETAKGFIEIIKKGFTESKIVDNLSKQPIFFGVFIVAFLIIRYALIYNNSTFAYKGMVILLYSVLAILLRNFAGDIKALLKEKTSSKMSFIVTIFYNLVQIGALVLVFIYLK